ncbi:MAG: hypothetical protein ACREND_00660 [Gemmatimonadaceae bacterium]
MRPANAYYCIVAALLASAQACGDQGLEPKRSDRPVVASSAAVAHDSVLGSDAKFAQLAATIRGFGGLFYDSAGNAFAYLVDMAQASTAQSALKSVVANPQRPITFLHGSYDFLQLSGWKTSLRARVLAIPGVVFLDADEADNRVRVGVVAADVGTKVRQLSATLGVPDAALTVDVMAPAAAYSITLQDLNTPRAGGFQINWGSSYQFLCTIGPNGYLSGDTTTGYAVVNSHCTNIQGQVDGTTYYQPQHSVPFSFIGTEVEDPSYTTGGTCPAGQRCRTSDAALFKYVTAHPAIFQVGYIARTTFWDRNLGSIVMDTVNPRTKITQTGNWPYTGQWLHKVGRTTGWTYGPVTSTCVDTPEYENGQPTGITILCNDYVQAGAGAGDSGSPVFERDASGNAALEGILWGGDGAGHFIMSPIESVKNELGNLSFNAP